MLKNCSTVMRNKWANALVPPTPFQGWRKKCADIEPLKKPSKRLGLNIVKHTYVYIYIVHYMHSIRKSGMMIEIGEYSWRHCGDATRMKYCETPQDIQDLLMRMSPVEIAAATQALFVRKVARDCLDSPQSAALASFASNAHAWYRNARLTCRACRMKHAKSTFE